MPSAEAEDLSTSSSSCPCDRYWRPSRESSVLHALARLPDRVRLALTSSLFGRNPGRANARCGNPGCCARLRAKEYTSLRAASSCSRRSSIRAAGARQGRPRERADPTTDTGCRIEKVGLLPFSVGRPVSGVQSGVVRQFFANRKMLINQSGLAHVTVK